ncbi:hypothetical protein HMPREF9374_1173 [Desmospora sp. 8437]|nr:hypothetical protein HMPREF9374_1173 [Desmospora sp. 8437]
MHREPIISFLCARPAIRRLYEICGADFQPICESLVKEPLCSPFHI